jgi:hypothetical protein
MTIIPFNKLESTPVSHSPDFNKQYCYYKTSTDNSTPAIGEYTRFPSMQEIIKAVYTDSESPLTEVTYSVKHSEVESDNEILPVPEHATYVKIDPEPYYNEITKKNDIFVAYTIFNEDNFKNAYEYAINQKL